jgi:starch synthase
VAGPETREGFSAHPYLTREIGEHIMKVPMKDRMRVVIVSAEATPFTETGKLAEAIRLLSESLARSGCEVSLVLPKYRRPAIDALPLASVLPRLMVPLGTELIKTTVFKAEVDLRALPGSRSAEDGESGNRTFSVYFIENAKYFGRDLIFGSENAPYLDNDERFTFFSRAALEFISKARIGADILHCHDWPTALVPLFLRTQYAGKRHFRNTASVLTLYDAAAQGVFPPESFALTGLNWDFFTPDQLALNGQFNFLKAGLIFADALSATSEMCAESVRSGAAGSGLAAILARRASGATTAYPDFPIISVRPRPAEYPNLYRQAMESKRGGSYVR